MEPNVSTSQVRLHARSLPPWPFWLVLAISFLVRYLSTALHEAGHWAMLTFFGRGPVMGFSGLVQRWDVPPPNPHGWVHITFAGSEGWLRLASVPRTTGEWVIFLAAGPLVSLGLAWVGCALLYRGRSPAVRGLGLVLALVNSLGLLLFPLNYFLSSGDTAFIASYLRVSEAWLAVPYELLRGGALIAALVRLRTWRTRLRWVIPAFLGYVLTMPVLFPLDQAVRSGVAQGSPLFAPVAGWSAPVLVLHLVALATFVMVWRRIQARVA